MKSNKVIKTNKVGKVLSKIKTAKIMRPSDKITNLTRSTNNMSVDEMIALITDAIQFKFKSDKTAPGLTIAKLKNGQVYISVVRFNAPFGKEKKVEYKARSTNIMNALCDIAYQITGQTIEANPIEQLSRYIGVNNIVKSNVKSSAIQQ